MSHHRQDNEHTVRRTLRDNGFIPVPDKGKGRHEVWRKVATGEEVSIDPSGNNIIHERIFRQYGIKNKSQLKKERREIRQRIKRM